MYALKGNRRRRRPRVDRLRAAVRATVREQRWMRVGAPTAAIGLMASLLTPPVLGAAGVSPTLIGRVAMVALPVMIVSALIGARTFAHWRRVTGEATRRRHCPRCRYPLLRERQDPSGVVSRDTSRRWCPECGWSVEW